MTSPLMHIWNTCYLRLRALIGSRSSGRMRSCLEAAAAVASSDHDREMISFWAVDSVFEPANDLSELTSPRNRFLRRVRSDSEKRSTWEGLVSRARTLDSDQVLDHFTSVTGHSIDEVAACVESVAPTISIGSGSVVSIEAQQALGLSSFRPENQIPKPGRAAKPRGAAKQIGLQALASAFGVYLMLVMAGSWKPVVDVSTMPKHLPDYSWIELGSQPRGRFIAPNLEVSERYRTAVSKLQRANTSVFGYLPGMNRDLLNEGILEMESAIAFHQAMGYLYPQALMLLADAYLRAGQPHKAVPLIDQIIEVNANKAPDARRLSARLQRKGLYE